MKFEITSLSVTPESYYERKREPFKDATKLYIWTEGETLMENLMNRRSRPHTYYKKEIIPAVMEEIRKKFPKEAEDIINGEWGWRQKCGCSCPCSPGFIQTKNQRGRYSISVNVKFISE